MRYDKMMECLAEHQGNKSHYAVIKESCLHRIHVRQRRSPITIMYTWSIIFLLKNYIVTPEGFFLPRA